MPESRFGPTGGHGGNEFADVVLPAGARVCAVHIFADRYIDGLQFVFAKANDPHDTLPLLGNKGGHHHVLLLDDDEYLTGISGRSGDYVDSIRIHTNRRVSDVYGGHGGKSEFDFTADAAEEIVGYFGRAGWYVDALGLIARERSAAAVQPSERVPQPDDLVKVEGIGPKIAAILIENGVLDLADLAATPVDRLREILQGAGKRFALADPTTWPEQAALGARGDWVGMEEMQVRLKAGRKS